MDELPRPEQAGAGEAAAVRVDRSARLPVLLHDITFRRFLTGQSASLLGDQVALLAIPLVGVLVLHASAAQMGYLVSAGMLPSLLLSVAAGAWVDRHGHRRHTMLAADAGRALLMATIPICYYTGWLAMIQLYVVTFLVGVLDVFFFVSYSTLFISMVPPRLLMQGHSLVNGVRSLMTVAGQSAAGLLVAAFSAPGAVIVNALSFLASAGALSSIKPAEPPAETAGRGHLAGGARFLRHSAVVRAALGATATVNFFNYMLTAVFLLYLTRSLHMSPTELGLILGLGAGGGLVGAALATRVADRIGVGPAFMFGCLAFPAPVLLVPLARGSHPVVFLSLVAAEFASTIGLLVMDISIGAILAAVIPATLQARVSGAYRTVNTGVRPLGALAGGGLGSALGLHATVWIAAVGGLFGIVWLIPSPVFALRSLTAAGQSCEGLSPTIEGAGPERDRVAGTGGEQ